MAIVNLTPVLASIQGRIGNLVFYRRQNKICVRAHVIGHNPDTEQQRIIRNRFALAVKSWQNMTDEERYRYSRKARGLNMSGYNMYISQYMKQRFLLETNFEIAQIYIAGLYSPGIQSLFPSVSYPQKQVRSVKSTLIQLQCSPG